MINKHKIYTYFDTNADLYQKNSISFPWSIIRNNEAKIVLNFMGNVKNKIILDVGCGTGYYSRLLIKKKAKKVYAIDSSKQMLKNIKTKDIIKINQDAENFKTKNKFEKIVCAGLLEFVESAEKVLINIKKYSKKNCSLVILCPSNNLLAKMYKMYHSKNNIKINLFNTNKIENILKKSGWKIKKIKKVLFSNIILAVPKQ
jgi:2-polyprenyl-3-methyl-5-hydroxy-6-metoxy-1,4-benzoquinol methylase